MSRIQWTIIAALGIAVILVFCMVIYFGVTQLLPMNTRVAIQEATSTPQPTPTSDCAVDEFLSATNVLSGKLFNWTTLPNERDLTNQTITSILQTMQAERANYSKLGIPSCAQATKTSILNWIDVLFDAYSTYQKNKDFPAFQARILDAGDKAQISVNEQKLLLVRTGKVISIQQLPSCLFGGFPLRTLTALSKFESVAKSGIPDLGKPLSNSTIPSLQQIRNDYSAIDSPNCVQSIKNNLLNRMDNDISAFVQYGRDGNNSGLLSKLNRGLDMDNAIMRELDQLKTIPVPGNPQPTATAPSSQVGNNLKIIDWTWYRSPTGNYIYVDGQIQNTSSRPMRSIKIYVVLRDSSKNLLSTDSAYADGGTLLPGQKTTFKVITNYRTGVQSVEISNIEWIWSD